MIILSTGIVSKPTMAVEMSVLPLLMFQQKQEWRVDGTIPKSWHQVPELHPVLPSEPRAARVCSSSGEQGPSKTLDFSNNPGIWKDKFIWMYFKCLNSINFSVNWKIIGYKPGGVWAAVGAEMVTPAHGGGRWLKYLMYWHLCLTRYLRQKALIALLSCTSVWKRNGAYR